MLVKESIEKFGYFWLPGKEDKKYPGTLKIKDQGEVELELIGIAESPFEEFHESLRVKRIIGLVEGRQLATLDDSIFTEIGGSVAGISRTKIRSNFSCLGASFDDNEEVKFNRVNFSVEGLDEWLLISGFKIENNWELNSASIKYEPPSVAAFKLTDAIEFSFVFEWTTPGFPTLTEAKITQKAYISLRSKELLPKQEFISLIFKITNFLSLLINKVVSVNSITGFSSEKTFEIDENEKIESPIKIYYGSYFSTEVRPVIHWHEMLMTFRNVSGDFERYLKNWLEKYENSGPAFNLFFASRSESHKYLEGRFLSLAQGIETLHRRRSGKSPVMPAEEFSELLKKLLEACPPKRRDWFSQKMGYFNELSLANRIKDLLDSFPFLYPDEIKNDWLKRKIVNTRNYFTHYGPDSEKNAATGMELYRLCEKLEGLFLLHLLKEIGMNDETIKSLVFSKPSLKSRLSIETGL